MKTSKLISICMSLLQALACGKYEVPPEQNAPTDDRMTFGVQVSPYAGGLSKFSVVTDMPRSFGALGYVRNSSTRTPDYMYDEQIEATGDIEKIQDVLWCEYATVNSYPDPDGGAELYFYGYAPYGVEEVVLSPRTHPGVPYLDYSVPGNIKEQYDLLIGSSAGNWSGKTSGFVKMNFRHALSQIRLYVDETNTASGIITKLALRDVMSEGRIQLDGSGNTAGKAADFTVEKLSIPFEPGRGTSLVGEDNPFMMLPQQCTGSIYVELLIEGQTYKCECSLKGDEWKAGKVISYYLKFNAYEDES